MTIEKTIEIPANHRIYIDLPSQIPADKARPVIIVQSDPGQVFNSIILCLFTTFESSHIPTRVHIIPDKTNGLKKESFAMTEKLIAIEVVPKCQILEPAHLTK
jgi:mRNA interferase MazF